jgi:hypothetical protein
MGRRLVCVHAAESNAPVETAAGWRLVVQALHFDDRVSPRGVVGVLKPLIVLEPSDGTSPEEEMKERQAFLSACGRDGATGDRLLILRIRPASDRQPGALEISHILTAHSFQVPDDEWPWIEKISQLASVQVTYRFRSGEELQYRGVVTDDSDSTLDLDGDGPELWTSRFGRAARPNPHVRALEPVSRNLMADASSSDVIFIDLARFAVPSREDCIFCAKPLEGEKTNREHLVPDWMRALVSEAIGVAIDGVVAPAHEACNGSQSPFESDVRASTMRRLAGEDLPTEELGLVGYWMIRRMALIDRAIGIEKPRRPSLVDSFKSANVVLPPLYTCRLGDDDHPSFRTLVLGPWIYHLCWSEEGCDVDRITHHGLNLR